MTFTVTLPLFDLHMTFMLHATSYFMAPWLGHGATAATCSWATPRFRAEKLFPGPHLFAGAAIVVIWAVSAAMVPFMEKGPGGHTGMDSR